MTQLEQGNPSYAGNIVSVHNYTSPLVDVMGAQYFVSTTPLDSIGQQLDLLGFADSVYLYRNRQAAPRSFIVPRTVSVQNEAQALQALGATGFSPCSFAIIESSDLQSTPSDVSASCVGIATIEKYEPSAVEIHAETPVDAMLVLNDAYYPGWQVTVDGKEQHIYRVDGEFRGVRLMAGEHEVIFAFRPRSVIFGGVLSALSLICAVLLVIVGACRRMYR